MGKQIKQPSEFDKLYDQYLSGNYDDNFNSKVFNGVLSNKKYEDDSIDLSNSDFLVGDENPYTFRGGLDLNSADPFNEIRASNQGGWSELRTGLGRVGSKIAREVLNTAGAVGGLGAAIAGNTKDLLLNEDKTDFLNTTFNNAFIKATNEAFDKVNKDYLPLYVSDAVTNGGFMDKVTNGEFWATEGADGVGYLISAFAPGAVLKSLNVGNKILGGASKLTSLRYGKSIETSRRFLEQAGMTATKIDGLIIPAANTFFEAGTEARGVSDTLRNNKNEAVSNIKKSEDYINKVNDTRVKLGNDYLFNAITKDEYESQMISLESTIADQIFEEQVSSAMMNTFLKNIAILAGPNYIQSKLIYGKNGASKLLDNINKPNVILKGGQRMGGAFLSEGSEEVAQTAVEHRNVSEATKGNLGKSIADDYSLNTFGADFIKTLGTTEGQVAGFLGGILGSPISIVSGVIQDRKDYKRDSDARARILNGSVSLNDINLNIYETETVIDPETNEEVEIRKKDSDGNPILILDNVAKVKKALDFHQELSEVYDEAVESGNVEAVEQIVKKAESELIMNFIGEDEMTIDALKEHLKLTMPTEGVSKSESKANLQRQTELLDKATHLRKEMLSFNETANRLIKLNNETATPAQTKDFLGNLMKSFINETARVYDLQSVKNKLEQESSKLEKNTEIVEVDNVNFDENKDTEFDRTTLIRVNPRLEVINKMLESVNNQIQDSIKFIDSEIWDNKFLNEEFNKHIEDSSKLAEDVEPTKVLNIDETKDAISNAQSLEELDAIDLMNDPFLTRSFNAKKAELEEIVRAEREAQIAAENENAENENIDNAINSETAKEFTKTNRVGDIVEDPFTGQESVIESISKNSIGLRDIVTNQTSIYEFEEDLRDDISADEVIVTDSNPIKPGATHSDHKTVGIEYENPVQFTNYIMEPRDKTGDIITFQLNKGSQTVPIKPEGQKAIDLINSKDPNRLEILKQNRQLLIDTLPITFIYNGGPATSWSSFNSPNAKKLRENIVNALIQGANLSDLSTKVTNQENASFNTKFENGKPVKNNPLDLEFVKSLNETNPENNVTLYHVSKEGKLILVSDNKSPLLLKSANDLSSQKGQIFIGLINPKGNVVPAKLNFSKLNNAKASTLAQIYGELLKDMSLAEKSINQLKVLNPTLFEEVQQTLSNEIELLGNKTSDITLAGLIELLVYESSSNDKSITYEQDENGNNFIEYDNQIYNENNLDKLGEALSSKYHNVITITKEDSINPTINFKNPAYIKYLFSQGIVTTNLNVEGSAFLQSTATTLPIEKGRGSELWIDSNVDSKLQVEPKPTNTVTLQELIKDKVKELNDRINAILDTIPEGSDTATAPEFMMTEQGQFITEIGGVEIGKARFDFEKMTTDGGPVTYKQLREEVVDIITKNYDDIVKNITPKVTTTSQTSSTQTEIEADKTEENENNLENNNIELLNPEDIRRPNGSIGTQGFDPSQMKDLVKYMSELLNLNIPENLLDKNIDELKPLIDYIKNNEDIKNKIIEYVKSNPSIITRLPDDTIHFEDGNHRANLLNIIGSDVIPVIDKNNQENIRNSENNSVSLPKNNVTMSNEFNIPGTEANKEYEKAVKELEGEDLVDYNNILIIIKKARSAKDNMISRGNTAAAEIYENTIKTNEELLRTKVETIIKNKKC